MNWILNRLKEPSTYRGLVWLATALGVSLSPEAWEYITTIGMGAAGLIGVLTSEKATRVDIQLLPIEPVIQHLQEKLNWLASTYRKSKLANIGFMSLLILLLIAAILLVAGCSSPCSPSITPSAITPTKRQTAATFPAGVVESIGIQCEWRFR